MNEVQEVVVVSADPELRDALRARLRRSGMTVARMFPSLEDAAFELASRPADTVLVDVRLTEPVSGFDAAGIITEKLGIAVIYVSPDSAGDSGG